jgi:hypothetical protein
MNKTPRMVFPVLFRVLCCTWTGVFLSCSFNMAGSVTEGGNVEVAGVVVAPNGKPVSGAQVALRTSDYLKDTVGIVPPRSEFANAVTDNNGRFKLDSLGAGEYCITATSGESLAVLVKLDAQPGSITLPPDTLHAASKISGTVVNQSKAVNATYVQVFGLDRIARVDSASGAYQLTAIPEGTYRLQVEVSSPLFKPFAVPNVTCSQGQIKIVDTITIAPFYGEDYSAWPYSMTVKFYTTPAGASVAGTVVNFPAVVRLRGPVFAFGQCLADGHDLRFANSKGVHLPFEIERFDPSDSIADVWVLVDTIKGNDSTAITMYWGNQNAVVQSLASSVFDTGSGYEAVWHLNNRGLTERVDATANANNAAPAPGTYEGDEWTYGLIGGCDSLDDNDDHLVAPSINPGKAVTLSMWINMYEMTASLRQYFIGKAGPVAGKPPFYSLMFSQADNQSGALAMNLTTNGKPDSVSGGTLTLNAWYNVVGTYDGTSLKVYVNGVLAGSKPAAGPVDTSAANVYIGYYDKLSQKLHGKIDEVRIMKTAVGGDFIKLSYENQKENSTLVGFGN